MAVFMINFRSLRWWYWLVTVGLLTVGLAGHPVGFALAMGLTAFQALHFALRERNPRSFTVQVRLGYLIVLSIAYPEGMRVLYWMPWAGTVALLLFGYCTMARIVSLMPWNRHEPFSLSLLRRTFLTPPVQGSILQRLPQTKP